MVDKLKLLIADDNFLNIEPLEIFFEEFYDILIANTGEDAISIARKQKPFAILMDIQMPRTNGLIATKTLKEDETTKHIPIIVITANPVIGDEQNSLNFGANHFLKKPFDLNALHKILTSYEQVVK